MAGAAATFGYYLLGIRASHLESELPRPPESDMAAALESHGMQVRVLDGALASMDELLAASPEVIVMDMHLPDASGLDLARIIRQEERFLSTPIVFLTADRSVRTRQAVFSNGGFDLIGKPMDPAELVSMVRSRGLE